ncbi:UNVERIFIED_CONTAM: toxoplasma gondii family A protein [Hammondia hammondi]|eukprot:XP_008887114.1 toxoplasma gondii family A protein [Hammondia hammondi]
MEGQTLRAVCLTLLVGTFISSAASETDGSTPAADFTTIIPKEGFVKDVKQVFKLGPSSTLQVIDKTGSAVYLPEENKGTNEPLVEPFSTAYRYENGACDFNKTIRFKEVFPGYSAALWVREPSSSGESYNAIARGPVRYTFTNPPADYLGGGLSFCVRFKTVLPSGSNSGTSTTTRATPATSSDTKPTEGVTPEAESTQDPSTQPSSPPPSATGPGSSGNGAGTENGGHGSEEDRENGLDANGSRPDAPPALGVNNGEDPHSLGLEFQVAPKTQNVGNNGLTSSAGVEENVGSRLRRLNEIPEMNGAFLTIVVHSGSWGLAGRISALSLFLLSVASSLLPVS